MTYKTYGRLKMFSKWEFDKSIFGHALEAALISVAVMGGRMLVGDTPQQGFLIGSALALAWYWGREKRDCETGMGLPSGSPKAWLFMWWRPRNILDMVGPIAIHLFAWWIICVGF